MRLHIDLATNQIVQSQTRLTSLSNISGKRGDIIPLELVFVQSGAGVSLGDGAAITFGAKVQGDYGGSPLVLSTSFAQTGTAPLIYYSGTLDLNSEPLLAAMDDSADYLDLMAEVTWTIGESAPTTTQTIKLRVANDIVRGDELTPTALPTPEDWLAARAVRFDQAQILTTEQKQQARENIGAAASLQESLDDVDDNAAKLASSPSFGELYRITGEKNRIERFVGGAIAGFSISNLNPSFGMEGGPLRVITQPTGTARPYFGQCAPSDYLYCDWDGNTPNAWTIQSGDGSVWVSEDDVDHPLDVSTWVKVWVEADEENPVFPPLPTLVAAPAANDAAWVVERNTVALTVDNALGTDVTINGVLCTNGEQTFVGWVDPTEITSSGYAVYAVGVEVSGGSYIPQNFSAAEGATFSIPFALPPRCAATLYLVD